MIYRRAFLSKNQGCIIFPFPLPQGESSCWGRKSSGEDRTKGEKGKGGKKEGKSQIHFLFTLPFPFFSSLPFFTFPSLLSLPFHGILSFPFFPSLPFYPFPSFFYPFPSLNLYPCTSTFTLPSPFSLSFLLHSLCRKQIGFQVFPCKNRL